MNARTSSSLLNGEAAGVGNCLVAFQKLCRESEYAWQLHIIDTLFLENSLSRMNKARGTRLAGRSIYAAMWMSEVVASPGKLEVLEKIVLKSMGMYGSFHTITLSKYTSCSFYGEYSPYPLILVMSDIYF